VDNSDKHLLPDQLLLASCMKADRYAYMAAQNEAYAIAEQLKLYATALYDKQNP